MGQRCGKIPPLIDVNISGAISFYSTLHNLTTSHLSLVAEALKPKLWVPNPNSSPKLKNLPQTP